MSTVFTLEFVPATSDRLRGAMFFEVLGMNTPHEEIQEFLHWRADLKEFLEPLVPCTADLAGKLPCQFVHCTVCCAC